MNHAAVSLLRRLGQSEATLTLDELANQLCAGTEQITSLLTELKTHGFKIAESQNGCRLIAWPESLIPEAIAAQLPESSTFAKSIRVYRETTSSNDLALDLGAHGGQHGEVIFALSQPAGRGRLQRQWHSPADGLWFSVLLRPELEFHHWPRLGIATGIGIARAASLLTHRHCQVKWPNDVILGSRKLAGVLLESRIGHPHNYLVIGIGININNRKFPPELQRQATSLKLESGRHYNLSTTAATLLDQLGLALQQAASAATLQHAFDELSWLHGQTVTIINGNRELTGVAQGIDASGALLLRQYDNSVVPVTCGDATVSQVKC